MWLSKGRDEGSHHHGDGSNRGRYGLRVVSALKAVQMSLKGEHTAPQGVNGRLMGVKRGGEERGGHLISRVRAEKSCINRGRVYCIS